MLSRVNQKISKKKIFRKLPDLPLIFRKKSAILYPYRYLQTPAGKGWETMAAFAIKLIGTVLVVGLVGLLLEDKFIFSNYEK